VGLDASRPPLCIASALPFIVQSEARVTRELCLIGGPRSYFNTKREASGRAGGARSFGRISSLGRRVGSWHPYPAAPSN
jgi:hypothetical protein